MRASQNAVDLIKQFESCRLQAYEDVGGVWTVGWGTTGPGIHEGTTVSQGVADAMLKSDVAQVSDALSRMIGISCNQNQFDSCVSLAYNIGITAFKNSTLLKLLLKGEKEAAGQEFLRWDKVKGQPNAGLASRRAKELALFLS